MDGGEGEAHHRNFEFSLLLVGLIGILFGAIVIVTFHFIVMSFNRRNRTTITDRVDNPIQLRTPSNVSASSSTTSTSHLISVYRSDVSEVKQQGRGDEMECVICLGEIMDGEEVRVMGECGHTFHVACIDAWLCTHHNCPVCRARVAVRDPLSEPDAVIVYVPVSRL